MSDEATTTEPADGEGFDWMMVEIFGHRKHYGRGKEIERFGSKMLRIDVPQVEWAPAVEGTQPSLQVTGWHTLSYGGAAIFSNALTDEQTVLRLNAPYRAPHRVSLPPPDDGDDDAASGFRGARLLMPDAPLTEARRRELAVTAAAQAVEAATELLRFAREGDYASYPFHPDVEPLEKLCDAAKLTAEITDGEPDEDNDRNQLVGALEKFISGWA